VSRLPALGLALLCLQAGACVRFGYWVRHDEEPLAKEALRELRPGQDDLGTCLHRLGAPHLVWEYAGDGAALGWVWRDSAGWEFDASYALPRVGAVRFGVDMDSDDVPGVVLWFDDQLVLERWQQGRMRTLTAALRRPRAAPVDPP
jgi:hypothetical protein